MWATFLTLSGSGCSSSGIIRFALWLLNPHHSRYWHFACALQPEWNRETVTALCIYPPGWTAMQWALLEAWHPELGSQIIAKFLQHGILHSTKLLSIKKNSPPPPPYGSTGKSGAQASCPLLSQTSNPSKRWVSPDAFLSPVHFYPQWVSGEVKISLGVLSVGKLKVNRYLVPGRYPCETPACKAPQNADGNYYFHTSA